MHFILQYVHLHVLTVYLPKKALGNIRWIHGLRLGLVLLPSYCYYYYKYCTKYVLVEQVCKKGLPKPIFAIWCIHKQNSGETSKQKAAVITAIITDEKVEQELRCVEEWSHGADEEWVIEWKRGEGEEKGNDLRALRVSPSLSQTEWEKLPLWPWEDNHRCLDVPWKTVSRTHRITRSHKNTRFRY